MSAPAIPQITAWDASPLCSAAEGWLRASVAAGAPAAPAAALLALVHAAPKHAQGSEDPVVVCANDFLASLQQHVWQAHGGSVGVLPPTPAAEGGQRALVQCAGVILYMYHTNAVSANGAMDLLLACLGTAAACGGGQPAAAAVRPLLAAAAGLPPILQNGSVSADVWWAANGSVHQCTPPLMPLELALPMLTATQPPSEPPQKTGPCQPQLQHTAAIMQLATDIPLCDLRTALTFLPTVTSPLHAVCAATPDLSAGHMPCRLAAVLQQLATVLPRTCILAHGGVLLLPSADAGAVEAAGTVDPLATPLDPPGWLQGRGDSAPMLPPTAAWDNLCRGGHVAALMQVFSWLCDLPPPQLRELGPLTLAPPVRGAVALLLLLTQQVRTSLASIFAPAATALARFALQFPLVQYAPLQAAAHLLARVFTAVPSDTFAAERQAAAECLPHLPEFLASVQLLQAVLTGADPAPHFSPGAGPPLSPITEAHLVSPV